MDGIFNYLFTNNSLLSPLVIFLEIG